MEEFPKPENFKLKLESVLKDCTTVYENAVVLEGFFNRFEPNEKGELSHIEAGSAEGGLRALESFNKATYSSLFKNAREDIVNYFSEHASSVEKRNLTASALSCLNSLQTWLWKSEEHYDHFTSNLQSLKNIQVEEGGLLLNNEAQTLGLVVILSREIKVSADKLKKALEGLIQE